MSVNPTGVSELAQIAGAIGPDILFGNVLHPSNSGGSATRRSLT